VVVRAQERAGGREAVCARVAAVRRSGGGIFCLIESGSLQSIPLPISSIGKEVTAEVAGGGSVSLIVSPRADPILAPSGGTTIDEEARTSIDQILTTLRQNGLIAT